MSDALADAPLMPAPTLRMRGSVVGVACAAALAFGVLLPMEPKAAVAAVVLIPMAFAAPVAGLSVLIAVTVLVPFAVQDTFAVIGGRDKPSLLVVDALMLLGLLRVGWLIVRGRLKIDRPILLGVVLAAVFAAALAWGIAHDADLSTAGHEARRTVLGVGAFLLAWPLMADRAARRRLSFALVGIGLTLGLWGLAQWLFSVGYTTQADVGVRPGVDLTSSGRGQLQGGMYAFPVAVTLAWAVLVSGGIRHRGVQCLLAAIVLLNVVCVLLTYERTFWVATGVACVGVVLMSGARARRLALRWAGAGAVVLVAIATIAPGEARTAVERLVSVAQVSTDESFTSRLVESRAVGAAIRDQPITGSGFGATITWGEEDVFGTVTTPFVHNGYLWLAWKIGIPAAAFVVLLLCWAILRRAPNDDAAEWRALRRGCQTSLLALLLVCLTFPAFDALGITATMGLLAAISLSGRALPQFPSVSGDFISDRERDGAS